MFETLKKLIGLEHEELPAREAVAAGLLLELVRMDHDFDAAEQAALLQILEDRFGIDEAQARALIARAPRTTYDDSRLLGRIAKAYTDDEKEDLLAMLWEMAMADGALHRLETHAVYEIAHRLAMPPGRIEAARAKARQWLARNRTQNPAKTAKPD